MLLEKKIIESHNSGLESKHARAFSFVSESVSNIDNIIQKLKDFQVAIPSWALGTGGTRFGRFSGAGEPGSLEQKIEDVGLLHALNRSSGAISLHIPWDIPEDASKTRQLAQQFDLRFDAVNSNTFQDQPNQNTVTNLVRCSM